MSKQIFSLDVAVEDRIRSNLGPDATLTAIKRFDFGDLVEATILSPTAIWCDHTIQNVHSMTGLEIVSIRAAEKDTYTVLYRDLHATHLRARAAGKVNNMEGSA